MELGMAENPYQPISCDDHDLLEAASVGSLDQIISMREIH